MPTGSGKSYVAGSTACSQTVFGRVLILAHVKELVAQNADAIRRHDPLADIGIYCAGLSADALPNDLADCLGRTDAEITSASIQSIYRQLHLWEDVGLIMIDEAHRITPVGGKLYRAVLDQFPGVPLVALTATPFRMGTGFLHKGEHALFDRIAYEITHEELVAQGYLAPFNCKGSEHAYETDGLRKVAGEFNPQDLNELTLDFSKTRRILAQVCERARDRDSWLIFAINTNHARFIRNWLNEHGIETGIVYDGMAGEGLDRDEEIAKFKMGFYRALVNVNILTTGFDYPELDCVVLLRPLASAVLYIQCLGRGTRLSPGKEDCLILDYGGNISRHGDFSKPGVSTPSPSKRRKDCPECGERNSTQARYCAACHFRFENMFKQCPKCKALIDRSAQQCSCGHMYPVNEAKLDVDGKTIISNQAVWVQVDDWKATKRSPFIKKGEPHRPDYVYIKYKGVDGVVFEEYVFPESTGARTKFEVFWVKHGGNRPCPGHCADTIARWGELTLPESVKVVRSGKYYNILARKM